jgi:hypothetical protein
LYLAHTGKEFNIRVIAAEQEWINELKRQGILMNQSPIAGRPDSDSCRRGGLAAAITNAMKYLEEAELLDLSAARERGPSGEMEVDRLLSLGKRRVMQALSLKSNGFNLLPSEQMDAIHSMVKSNGLLSTIDTLPDAGFAAQQVVIDYLRCAIAAYGHPPQLPPKLIVSLQGMQRRSQLSEARQSYDNLLRTYPDVYIPASSATTTTTLVKL